MKQVGSSARSIPDLHSPQLDAVIAPAVPKLVTKIAIEDRFLRKASSGDGSSQGIARSTKRPAAPFRFRSTSSSTLGAHMPLLVALPRWAPVDFDMEAGKASILKRLISQGLDPATLGSHEGGKLIFTDVDHTLIKSHTKLAVVHQKTGEPFRFPDTGEVLMVHNHGAGEQIDEWAKTYPELANYHVTYKEMGDSFELEVSETINSTVAKLRRSQREHNTPTFVVTARSADGLPEIINDYFSKRVLEFDGVFGVNNTTFTKDSGMEGLSGPIKKALTMALLTELYSPNNGKVSEVSYYEDHDENLSKAMQLLPLMFPRIKFSFYDILHKGQDVFEGHLVAQSHAGKLKTPAGLVLNLEDIENYHSVDEPLHG